MQSNQVAVHVPFEEIERLQAPAHDAAAPEICVARGDGIGPEIIDAVLDVLDCGGAQLNIDFVEMGSEAVRQGFHAGISPLAWRVLKERKVLLKAPTNGLPVHTSGSPNATIRKSLGLFASVRPCVAYYPYVATRHPNMRVTVVRENEEDLYAGIEHRHTRDMTQCLRLISRSGSERVIRHAFEFARLNHRRQVTCLTKDTALRLTDGLFRQVFEEVARDYPHIEHRHLLVDTGMARFVSDPDDFDVIVVPNVYGDILADVAAGMSGSLALSAVANMGYYGAMFEAAHGCALDIAGRNVANPSGLLMAGLMMLNYLGQPEAAQRIQHAWLRTLEDGVHTADITPEHPRARCVGTREFGREIAARLGSRARFLRPGSVTLPRLAGPRPLREAAAEPSPRHLVGVDVFLQWQGSRPDLLARRLRALSPLDMTLTMISNRGLAVWPQGMHQTVYTDHWSCRFIATGGQLTNAQVAALLALIAGANLDFIKVENLYDFGEERGYTSGPGQ